MKIVIASDNKGKIKQFKQLFSRLNFSVISKKEAGFLDVIKETGKTFRENAQIKATAVFNKTLLPTIADDSGLEVFALNKKPGIFSARYSEEENIPATDEKNNIKLLNEMKGIKNRKAQYVCALCFIYAKGKMLNVLETVQGEISTSLKGENGFGYDPLFSYNGKTFAELDDEFKNKISHRGKALLKLLEKIENIKNNIV